MRGDEYRISPEPRPDGLHRIAQRHMEHRVFDLLFEADGMEEAGLSGFRSGDRLREAASGLKELLLAGRRPCDRLLDDWFLHTDPEEYARRTAGHGRHLRNRLVVDATLTSKDNLSVRFRPGFLGDDGRWAEAPEWRLPYLFGTGHVMERPEDELLFVRGVYWLTAGLPEPAHGGRGGREAQRRETALACRIVHAAFWLEIRRLSQRFDVQVGTYVALLSADADGKDVVGLELVDGLAEHRGRFARLVGSFEEAHGHSPRAFHAACLEARGEAPAHAYANAASRRLRGRSGPSRTLTPAVVASLFDRLGRAERYGLFDPADARAAPSPAADPGGIPGPVRPETAPPPNPPTQDRPPAPMPPNTVQTMPKPRPAKTARPSGDAANRPGPAEPPLYRTRTPGSPPPYPEKATFLKDEEKAEFGVETVHELVEALNAAWARTGRRPLAQGSFPTSRVMLRTVLIFMREARRGDALGGGLTPA